MSVFDNNLINCLIDNNNDNNNFAYRLDWAPMIMMKLNGVALSNKTNPICLSTTGLSYES